MAGPTWIASNIYETIPPGAFRVGMDTDGSAIFVGRTFAMGDYLVVKIIPDRQCATASHQGQEIPVFSYGVLCGNGFSWIESKYGQVPQGAVVGGKTALGEILFIGRASIQGSLTPGKIHQSHACLYIPFQGKEHRIEYFEALVQTHKNEIQVNPILQLNVPQNVQIFTPILHSPNFQKSIIPPQFSFQNQQNIMQNGQHVLINGQIVQKIMPYLNNDQPNVNLVSLIPSGISNSAQILQNSRLNDQVVQQSIPDDNSSINIRQNGQISPSLSQLPPDPLINNNNIQKTMVCSSAQTALLNGLQMNFSSPPVVKTIDQPTSAQIMIQMQNLQINNRENISVSNTNPFQVDNTSFPVNVKKAPFVLPDVRKPPQYVPPAHIKGYFNIPPPQLPPNYRTYNEQFPMITEINGPAKSIKLSGSQISKTSATASEDSLSAVFSKSCTLAVTDTNFSMPPPNYAKITQLNLPTTNNQNKNVKPAVAEKNINQVASGKSINLASTVINSIEPINLVNYVPIRPNITNVHKAPEKPAIKIPMKEVQATQDDNSCVICLDNPLDAALYKCGHQMCYDCAFKQWKAVNGGICPICRAKIDDIIRTYKV